MTTQARIQSIEAQIRGKGAEQLRASEFVPRYVREEVQAHRYVANSLGRNVAELLMQKAELRGMPSVSIEAQKDGPFHRVDGDYMEANVVVVHPALWAEITALLRSLR